MSQATLAVRRISGHAGAAPGEGVERDYQVCKLVDTTTCIGDSAGILPPALPVALCAARGALSAHQPRDPRALLGHESALLPSARRLPCSPR